jgi:hypothetical protein
VKSDRRVGRQFALARSVAARAGADVQIDLLAGDLRARPEAAAAGITALELRGWLVVAAGAEPGTLAIELMQRGTKRGRLNAAPTSMPQPA